MSCLECRHYPCGDTHHAKTCEHYPRSMSEDCDALEASLKEMFAALDKANFLVLNPRVDEAKMRKEVCDVWDKYRSLKAPTGEVK